MKSINNYNVSGRLTRDAELKYTSNGSAICSFSIAYNRSCKEGDSWKDKPCFIDCKIFSKRGEALRPLLLKGKQVFISGELDHQRWNSNDKQNSKHVLIVNDIVIESSGKREIQDDGFDDTPY